MPNQPPAFDPAIAAFYQQTSEENRLGEGAALLEALRTRELIERYAPPVPATIIDIGGAAGAYALWLAEAGYAVHLIDAVPRHIEEAGRRSAASARPLASCSVGDARAVQMPDAIADVVLMLGPLYHLTDAADRLQSLGEARRILKAGGRLLAAGISRWASTIDGLVRDLYQDPAFAAIVAEDIRTGQHRNPTERLDYFTTAYFHRPDDLREEAAQSGFDVEGVFGIEGPGWLLQDVHERLADARRRDDVLRVARLFEADAALAAISAHLLVVAHKPPATARE